MPLCFHLL